MAGHRSRTKRQLIDLFRGLLSDDVEVRGSYLVDDDNGVYCAGIEGSTVATGGRRVDYLPTDDVFTVRWQIASRKPGMVEVGNPDEDTNVVAEEEVEEICETLIAALVKASTQTQLASALNDANGQLVSALPTNGTYNGPDLVAELEGYVALAELDVEIRYRRRL